MDSAPSSIRRTTRNPSTGLVDDIFENRKVFVDFAERCCVTKRLVETSAVTDVGEKNRKAGLFFCHSADCWRLNVMMFDPRLILR